MLETLEMKPSTFVPGFSRENEVSQMLYKQLGDTNIYLSKLGFGGGALGGIHTYGEYDEEAAGEVVIDAIRSGINYIDVAPHYGLGTAETFLGKVLKKIPRKSYYISTKVGRLGNQFNFKSEAIIKGFEDSLKRLQLDAVDIIIIHDVEFADSLDIILTETLPAVEELVRLNKAKLIGISGYPLSTLYEVVTRSSVKIDCVLSYSRDTLIDNTLQEYVLKMKEKGTGVINAGCVGMRLLTNQGPPGWHPASEDLKQLCRSAAEYCRQNDVELGRLALFHSLNQPGSDTYLVGMNDAKTLRSNLDILRNGLTEKEQNVLQQLRLKFFIPGLKCHWEGVEVEAYRQNKL